MMNHSDIRHKLSDYIDDAVSAVEKAEIDAHLKTCATCSDALEELRKTIEQVRTIEEIEPPAWMTGKIMAQVRAEAEQNKSIFQRFLRPLAYKLPMQTVAVLFLAVTAYYIYQNIKPAGKYAEAPMKIAAKKTAPEPSKIAKEEKVMQAPAARLKKAEQEPGYKSLDMKYAYEKPAPPVPMKEEVALAPAPAAPTAGTTADAPELKRMRTLDPKAIQGTAGQPAGMIEATKTKPAASPRRMSMADADKSGMISLTLTVTDVAAVEKEIERMSQEVKGAVIRREPRDNRLTMIISVDSTKLSEFKEKVGKLGELIEKGPVSRSPKKALQITIKLIPIGTP